MLQVANPSKEFIKDNNASLYDEVYCGVIRHNGGHEGRIVPQWLTVCFQCHSELLADQCVSMARGSRVTEWGKFSSTLLQFDAIFFFLFC